MNGLKPIGSEKLQGDDKIKRILEIAKYKENFANPINETVTTNYQVKLSDGVVYEIAKEKMGYVIKKQINESVSEYIEPMKNRKHYSSYSSAFKRLNLLAKEVNKLNNIEEGISLFTEQKKYTLKVPKSSEPSEPEMPVMDMPTPPSEPTDMGPEEPSLPTETGAGPEEPMDMPPSEDMGDESMDMPPSEDMGDESMGGEADDEPVTYKSIQKLVGRLSQKLRDYSDDNELSSKDAKYIINSVLSAIDMNSLEDDDKEEIIARFDSEGEEDMGDMGDMSDEEPTDDEMDTESQPEDMDTEMSEDFDFENESEMTEDDYLKGVFKDVFKESTVDKVLTKYFTIGNNEKKFITEKKQTKKTITESKKKHDLKEIIRLSESLKQKKVAEKVINSFPEVTFVGKTNKGNLVFESKSKQLKVSPNGQIL